MEFELTSRLTQLHSAPIRSTADAPIVPWRHAQHAVASAVPEIIIHGTLTESAVSRDDRGNAPAFDWRGTSEPSVVAPGSRLGHPSRVELPAPSPGLAPSIFLNVMPDGSVSFWALYRNGDAAPDTVAASSLSVVVPLTTPDGRVQTARLVLDRKRS